MKSIKMRDPAMDLKSKIERASACASHLNGMCSRNGYPPFDCGGCRSWTPKGAGKPAGRNGP